MNKYLLISALFGFVFNSFVFGGDKLPDRLPLSKCVIELNNKVYYPTGNLVGGKEGYGCLDGVNICDGSYGKGPLSIIRRILSIYEFKCGEGLLSRDICPYYDVVVEGGDIYKFKLVYGCLIYVKIYDGLDFLDEKNEFEPEKGDDGDCFTFFEIVKNPLMPSSLFDYIKKYNEWKFFTVGSDVCPVTSVDFYVTIECLDVFGNYYSHSLDFIINDEGGNFESIIPCIIRIKFRRLKHEETKVDNHLKSGGEGWAPASTGGGVDTTKIGGGVDSSKTGGLKDGKDGGIGSGEKGEDFSDGEKMKLPAGKGPGLGNIRIPSGGSSGSGSSSGSNSKPKKKRCGCKCSGK